MARAGSLIIVITIVALLLCAGARDTAVALTKQPRPAWMLGVGWGMGRGDFKSPDGDLQVYSEGGVALIRLGRMIGTKTMVAFNYSGWIIEFDESLLEENREVFASQAEDSTIIKSRRSQQQLALSIYWFPGNPHGASGGIYLRAGAGMGWAGTNQVPITPGAPQGHGNRIDEWGWGLSGEGGFEFWISSHATLGLGAFVNYMSINETLVDEGWFTGASVNFNVYF